MRNNTNFRTIGGLPINTDASAIRVMPSIESTSMSLYPYVTSTPPLSTTELSVGEAFWALFGRTPDAGSLEYWVGVLGAGASTTMAVNTIVSALASSLILDMTPAAWVAQLYYHVLGKMPAEDASGQAYWVGVMGGSTAGNVAQQVITASLGASGYAADTARNRRKVMESVLRLQKTQGVSLSTQDSRTVLLRTVGVGASYTSCMADVYRLLVSRVASTPNSWGRALTAVALFDEARIPDGAPTRQFRHLVWYNRAGEMMLASVFLPPNFRAVSEHRTIVAWHGGGWRQGYPGQIYNYCTALATGSDPSYVVLAPTYRLTAYGFTAPASQADAEDFYALVNAAAFIKRKPGKVGLFGESSGGHLACMLGATQNIHRVLALYPPIDLRGSPAVSAALDPYVDYYATDAALQASSSANVAWAAGRTTRFQLWHGTSDSFVPSAQTAALVTVAGSFCVARYRAGEGHGFSEAGQAAVLAAAIRFFDDRQALDV